MFADGSAHRLVPLARAAAAGNASALESLLVGLRGYLKHFIVGKVQDEDVAADLSQETLLNIARGITNFTVTSDTTFLSWCRAIANRVVIDWYRSRAVDPLQHRQSYWLVDDDLSNLRAACGEIDDQPSLAEALLLSCLRRAMEEIGDDAHHLLYMRFHTGARWDEIGLCLDISPSAAKRRFQRTQQRLRSLVLVQVAQLDESDRKMALRHLRGKTRRQAQT